MMTALDFLFGSRLGRIGAGIAGILALLGLFVHHERQVGAARATAQIEKQAHAQVKKADQTRARVRDPAARGVLDPYAGR